MIVLRIGPVEGVPISQWALLRRSLTFGSIFTREKDSGGPMKLDLWEVCGWKFLKRGLPRPKCDSLVLLGRAGIGEEFL